KEQSDNTEKAHVVEAGAPDGPLCSFGLARSERLADHRRRRIAHPPGRQQGKKDYPNRDGVTRKRGAAEARDNPNQGDPANGADRHLKDSGTRKANDSSHQRRLEPKVTATERDAASGIEQSRKSEKRAGAPSDGGCDRCADYTQSRKRANAEYKTGA